MHKSEMVIFGIDNMNFCCCK